MFTSAATARVLSTIAGELAPYVGATMATASVQGFSARLGLTAATMDRSNVEALLTTLAPALDVYVGRDRARALVAKIWSALDDLGKKS